MGTFPSTSLEDIAFPLSTTSYTNKGSIISIQHIKNTNLYIAGITETLSYEQALNQFGIIVLIILIIGTMIAFFIALYISRSIAFPIDRLVKRMKKVEKGDLAPFPPQSSIGEFHLLESSFNEMVIQIASLLELTREEEAKSERS